MDAPVRPSAKTKTPAKPGLVIKKVGVIGAGQMGNGIAHVIALAGYDVVLNDIKAEAIDKAIATINKNMTRQVAKGVIKDADMQAALTRIGQHRKQLRPAISQFRLS